LLVKATRECTAQPKAVLYYLFNLLIVRLIEIINYAGNRYYYESMVSSPIWYSLLLKNYLPSFIYPFSPGVTFVILILISLIKVATLPSHTSMLLKSIAAVFYWRNVFWY